MLTYSLSRREKALLLVLAIVLLVIVWFVFVFQRTTNEVASLESKIAAVDSEKATLSTQVDRMHAMQATIEKYKAQGVAATPVPTFDNMTALMGELNGIMAQTTSYTLSFDDLDTETSSEYILRGVTANYSCESFSDAEDVVSALAKGTFPCSIDSVSITDSSAGQSSRLTGAAGSGVVTAKVHITFFEKAPTGRA